MVRLNILFILFLFLIPNSKGTPSPREKNYEQYLLHDLVVELILDKYQIDILNRNNIEGYIFKYEDECRLKIILQTNKLLKKIYKIDICEKKVY